MARSAGPPISPAVRCDNRRSFCCPEGRLQSGDDSGGERRERSRDETRAESRNGSRDCVLQWRQRLSIVTVVKP
jgi:hypothetical protein